MTTGTVHKVFPDRGYCFVSPDGGGGHVFCHVRSLRDYRPGTQFREGARLRFEVQESTRSPGKLEAVNVEILDGVAGSAAGELAPVSGKAAGVAASPRGRAEEILGRYGE